MKLFNKLTNNEFEAEIVEINEDELKSIVKTKRFGFDWTKEQGFVIFKIVKEKEDEALGLMSLIDYPKEFRVHINLIENSSENKGKDKEVDRIAGCLIAYAAQISFEKGYLGFTSLVPKTELIGLYINKYGFKQFGRQLALDRMEAVAIINKYL